MPTTDPLLQGNVLLDIDGVGVVANFSSVSGISSEVEIVDNPYVTEQGKVYIGKLPGKPKTPTVTLKRGLTGATELWDWHTAVMQGTPDRRNGSVILMNTLGEEVLRYNFTNAMLSKISLSEGGATTSGVQIEEATIGLRDADQGVAPVDSRGPARDPDRAREHERDRCPPHRVRVRAPPRLRRRDRDGPSRGRHAPRDGPRRDHPPARPAGPGERGLPHDPAAVPGHHEARHAGARSTRA